MPPCLITKIRSGNEQLYNSTTVQLIITRIEKCIMRHKNRQLAFSTCSLYRGAEHMRPIILFCSVLCLLPYLLRRRTTIPTSSPVRRALHSELLQGGLLVVLGAAASLLADDALYFVERNRVTNGFLWSRRMLILSIVIPYVLMYTACLRNNFSLFFGSYHASQILHTYSIFVPLILTETVKEIDMCSTSSPMGKHSPFFLSTIITSMRCR